MYVQFKSRGTRKVFVKRKEGYRQRTILERNANHGAVVAHFAHLSIPT